MRVDAFALPSAERTLRMRLCPIFLAWGTQGACGDWRESWRMKASAITFSLQSATMYRGFLNRVLGCLVKRWSN